MPTVENQLRELAHHLDTEFTDVEVDELTPPGVESLVGPPVRLEPKPPRRRPGWVVAVTAAVVTLLLVGGAALLFGSFGQDQSPVITAPPAPTPSGEVSPSHRSDHGMAYDAESNRILIFGGTSKGELVGDLDDTWSYDLNSNTWIDMNPAPSPPNLPAMAYDAESDRVVLLGGLSGQTWAYDFNTNTWRNMSPVTRPLGGGAMAYDAESDRVVLFLQWTGAPDNETWTYDFNSNTWTKMEPTTRPSPRTWVPMAYDAESDRVILFGGIAGADNMSSLVESRPPPWVEPLSDAPARLPVGPAARRPVTVGASRTSSASG